MRLINKCSMSIFVKITVFAQMYINLRKKEKWIGKMLGTVTEFKTELITKEGTAGGAGPGQQELLHDSTGGRPLQGCSG